MYTNTLAFSYALEPPSVPNNRRTLIATLLFATGGIVGWPFSLALAIPYVLEELFVRGADIVTPNEETVWMLTRLRRLVVSGALAALLFVRFPHHSCNNIYSHQSQI